MITDGDLAMEWKNGDRFLVDHRSVSVPVDPCGQGSSKVVCSVCQGYIAIYGCSTIK